MARDLGVPPHSLRRAVGRCRKRASARHHSRLGRHVELYQRWRDALNRREDGRGQRAEVERVLLSVRSLYTDLHTWAVDEPEKWAPWVASCPVADSELRGFNVRQRRTKERMDDRVRQRQPLLSTLVAHLEDRYDHLRALLQHASPLPGGETFTLDGRC